MFEKEIKFIIDFTLNRIKKLGSFFTFEKLTSAEIHPAILIYISNKLDYLIYDDRKKLLQTSSFDYSGSEISKYFNLIGEEIKKNKRLAYEDLKTLVSHAVTFNINYLVRPNWTTIKLIYDEEKTRNVNEIKMMLNYLYYYDYVRNVFLGYFSKRKILSLSETEFGLILNKIDKQMFSEHTRDLIDNALVSIGDFFNEGGLNKTRISTQTIEVFLKEKNLMEALFKLRRSIPAEDKGKYDIEEIRKILYSKEPVKIQQDKEEEESPAEEAAPIFEEEEENISFEVEADIDSESIEDEPVIEVEEKKNVKEDFIEEEIPQEEVEYMDEEITDDNEKELETEIQDDFLLRYETELKSLEELEEQLNNLDKEDKSDKQIIEDEADKEESLTFDEIMSGDTGNENADEEIEEELSDELIIEEEEVNPFDIKEEKIPNYSAAARKNKDLLSFFSDKEMNKIISNVFNEDEEDFVNTMEKISESATYDEATEILKAVFSSYKVSPYSKDAVTLTNAVSNFFNLD